jgi:hypothetical protein
VLCLLGERKLGPPSLLKDMWSSSLESPFMGHGGDGGPL